jgi:hypothetical protein
MTPKNKVIEIVSEDFKVSGFHDEEETKKNIHSFLVIQRMVKQFVKTKVVNEKLLINNIIISLNIFGIETVNKIFRSILKDHEFGTVKSILIFLGCYVPGHDATQTNRIIDDILADLKCRYHLDLR